MNNPKKKRRTRSDKGVKRGARKVDTGEIPYVAINGPYDSETANKVLEEISRLASRPEGVVIDGKVSLNAHPECVHQAMKEMVDEFNEDTPLQMIVVDLPINRRLVLLKDENGEFYNGDVKDNRVYRRGQFVQVRKQRDGRVLVLGGRALIKN